MDKLSQPSPPNWPFRAGLIFVLRQRLGLDLAKDDPRLREVYAWLMDEFDHGRQTSVEWEELAPIVARAFGQREVA